RETFISQMKANPYKSENPIFPYEKRIFFLAQLADRGKITAFWAFSHRRNAIFSYEKYEKSPCLEI
ncbi:MAG: hypothetical protein ACXVBE_10170, partial [Bdellovibrionota bacterium]